MVINNEYSKSTNRPYKEGAPGNPISYHPENNTHVTVNWHAAGHMTDKNHMTHEHRDGRHQKLY